MSNSGQRQRETIRAIKNRAKRAPKGSIPNPSIGRGIRSSKKTASTYRWLEGLNSAASPKERRAWDAHFRSSNEPRAKSGRALVRRVRGLPTRPGTTGWKPGTKYWAE